MKKCPKLPQLSEVTQLHIDNNRLPFLIGPSSSIVLLILSVTVWQSTIENIAL